MASIDIHRVLKGIARFNPPAADLDEDGIDLWRAAFDVAGMTDTVEALRAVAEHYGTPGANRWITPGDVIGRMRVYRGDRVAGLTAEALAAGIDPDDPQWLALHKARIAAVAAGTARIPPLPVIAATRPAALAPGGTRGV